jgi:dolichyl-phosphate-mannose--protein O-mannosyl transferase
MLEIFVGVFALAAFYFALLDREQSQARASGRDAHHGWRVAAGAAGGAAAACKISGACVVIAVFALIAVWDVTARRRYSPSRNVGRQAISLLLLLVVVPLVLYMATYTGRLDGSLIAAPWADGSWFRAWVERQLYMLDFHGSKPGGVTMPWEIPMTEPPLRYVLERDHGEVREVLLFGNPLFWWGGFAALAYAALRWLRSRHLGTAAVVVIAFVSTYAAWLSITLPGRTVHLFYAVPIAPFIYLALAYSYVELATSLARRAAAFGIVVVAIAAFLFYLPILSARPLDRAAWRPRACSAQALWLDPVRDCGLSTATGAASAPAPR